MPERNSSYMARPAATAALFLALAVALAALTATAALHGASASDPAMGPVRAAELKEMVEQDCGSCHGLTMQGGLGTPLTVEAMEKWSEDELFLIIRDGVPGTPMPGWSELLTDSDISWIAAYLKGRTQEEDGQ